MAHRVNVLGKRGSSLLSGAALQLLGELHARFDARRLELLERRRRKTSYDFLPETSAVRSADWKIAEIPNTLLDRRVEITGPPEPKMTINALNSGASVFMADFEDALSPTWENLLVGQESLFAAVRRELTFVAPGAPDKISGEIGDNKTGGKRYQLAEKTATLFVRPRGWHLPEAHVEIDGQTMSGALFDFGLFFFHNAREQLARGAGPYFYLPKMESHLEARLWNDVFDYAEGALELPRGTIKATVLIETLPAAFEMDEILYELREHSAGLNCGRWDYIFSFIKKQTTSLLPDRVQLTMDKGFLRAYVQLLIRTCHRRGAYAIGGMAAQIPIKDDPGANEAALEKVRADKLREVGDGHDGTWVAHPGLVPLAKGIFDAHMPGPNQLARLREDAHITREDLLRVPDGTRSDDGLRQNVRVGVRYLESWLRGQGCVPLYNLMEDAATAEISRAQVWQQVKAGVVPLAKLEQVMAEELATFAGGRFADATALFHRLTTADTLDDFLTLPAYQRLLQLETAGAELV
jgi:malate synthase